MDATASPAPAPAKTESVEIRSNESVAPKQSRPWLWSLVWLTLLAFCGGTGVSALLWLSTIPPLPECQPVSPLASDADRLYCAQQAARSGDLASLENGLTLVKSWSKDHPLYAKAQQSMAEWSQAVLAIARQRIDQNDLKGAIATANKIPTTSPVYKQAQAEIANWRDTWKQGQTIYNQIQAALKAQKWQQASEQAQSISSVESDYWRDRLNSLRQQISAERLARKQLQQARDLAVTGMAEKLGQAIAIVQQIDAKSYAYEEAQAEAARWSQLLVGIAATRLERQDLTGAIAAAQQLPFDASLTPEVQDLVRFNQARQLSDTNQIFKNSLLQQLWKVTTVLPSVRQITSTSPFYSQAQTYLPQLEMQLQDLVQLQLANYLADLGHIPALQLAIGYAQAIPANRPGRLYAQTLIAQWRKEIQRIEDHPYLIQAQRLAKAGTIKQLKAAIAQAQVIAPGRALRPEAQTAIASWHRQIQTIEDKPLLTQAHTLAKQGNLAKAIQTAAKIRPDRALRKEAQAAIWGWQLQIQILEDRPLLNQAWGLANQGNLTGAIDLAGQISPGRALYLEAQAAISRWVEERAAYRHRNNEASEPSNDREVEPADAQSGESPSQPDREPANSPAESPRERL